jgi:hypothetical protein
MLTGSSSAVKANFLWHNASSSTIGRFFLVRHTPTEEAFMAEKARPGHIVLTSHPPGNGNGPPPIAWGAAGAAARGPVVGGLANPEKRNVIGAHSGSYALYRALAVAARQLDPSHVPDLTDTAPAAEIGPHAQWGDGAKIVSIDPYGHLVSDAYAEQLAAGWDIRPTIAVTRARIRVPELADAIKAGRLKADGEVLMAGGEVRVVKAAIEPVWHLPGIAERCGTEEAELRGCCSSKPAACSPNSSPAQIWKYSCRRSAVSRSI